MGKKMKQAEADIAIAVRDEKWITRVLNNAMRAFKLVAPFCPQYEKINFFNRKCKHCRRKKTICEASRPAKEELDKAQAKYKKAADARTRTMMMHENREMPFNVACEALEKAREKHSAACSFATDSFRKEVSAMLALREEATARAAEEK